jgi:hypothetical protein
MPRAPRLPDPLRQQRQRRQARVGQLAAEAGLLVYDDRTLAWGFAALRQHLEADPHAGRGAWPAREERL